jgi:hypothetical protein
MATKKYFFGLGTFSIKDGSEIRFWEDKWLGATSLHEQYPVLYSTVRHKGDTIAKVLETSPPNVSFSRDLFGRGLYLGMPYSYVWQISSYIRDLMNSDETYMRMVNYRSIHVQCAYST